MNTKYTVAEFAKAILSIGARLKLNERCELCVDSKTHVPQESQNV